jgi:AcrR family transcriptional regulator
MTVRRRLTPEVRRDELIGVATELFATNAYDDVAMEDVAARADVSRALLYRYFPSKRDLFAGVYQLAADQLLDVTRIDPDLPLEPQVVAGLDAHIDYFLANRSAVLTANRTLAGDPIIQAIIGDELAVLRERVLAAQPVDGVARDALSAVLMSWLTFVRVLCVDWLAAPAFSRVVLRDVCLGALRGSMAAL